MNICLLATEMIFEFSNFLIILGRDHIHGRPKNKFSGLKRKFNFRKIPHLEMTISARSSVGRRSDLLASFSSS